MIKYQKIHFFLSLFVSLIPLALVAGAAVMEFFIILSCFTFFFLNYKKIGLDYYKKFFFIIFLVFNFYLILSSILSENIFNSLKNTLFYFRFGVLAILICYLLDNFKKFKILFFYSLMVTLTIVIFYSIVDFLIFSDHSLSDRLSGLFGKEKIQGSFLLRITPIFIILYFYNKEYLTKIFHFIFYTILTLIFILIILSGERAAIFLMFIGISLVFLFLKMNLKKIFFYFLLSISIFTLTISFLPNFKERIIDQTYDQFFITTDIDQNIISHKLNFFSQGHEEHFRTAIIMFKKNYLKGVGVRNFRNECKKDIYKEVGMYYCTTHPHNSYMQILSETGLIGFSFFMIFLIFIFRKIYEFLRNIYTKDQKINSSLGICFVIILINFFPLVPTGSFFNNWLSTLYFMPIGFLLYELNYKRF